MTDTVEMLPGIDETQSFAAVTKRNTVFDVKIQLRDLTINAERKAAAEGRHLYAASLKTCATRDLVAVTGYLCRCTATPTGANTSGEILRHGWIQYTHTIKLPANTFIPDTVGYRHIWRLYPDQEAAAKQAAAAMQLTGYTPMRLERGLCTQVDPDLFFINKPGLGGHRDALSVCARCPVLIECARRYGAIEKRAATAYGSIMSKESFGASGKSHIQGIAAGATQEIRQCAYWATEGKRRLAVARRELEAARGKGAWKTILRLCEKRVRQLEKAIRLAAAAQPGAEKAWVELSRGILTQRQREKILDALMEKKEYREWAKTRKLS